MLDQRSTRQAPVPHNRMEPEGPTRYLKTDKDIRQYLQQDRKIVSCILVDSAITVLKRDFDFTTEQSLAFHAELQKEILNK